MASDEDACTNYPDFAVICSFVDNFAEKVKLTLPNIEELQLLLEDTDNVNPLLARLIGQLLRRINKSVKYDKWERGLQRFAHSYSHQDGWELERFGFKKAKIEVKLRVIKTLFEAQFDLYKSFKEKVNLVSAKELRLQPCGRDKNGVSYWCQLDELANLRIYKDDQDDETWKLVARSREELVALIDELERESPQTLGRETSVEESQSEATTPMVLSEAPTPVDSKAATPVTSGRTSPVLDTGQPREKLKEENESSVVTESVKDSVVVTDKVKTSLISASDIADNSVADMKDTFVVNTTSKEETDGKLVITDINKITVNNETKKTEPCSEVDFSQKSNNDFVCENKTIPKDTSKEHLEEDQNKDKKDSKSQPRKTQPGPKLIPKDAGNRSSAIRMDTRAHTETRPAPLSKKGETISQSMKEALTLQMGKGPPQVKLTKMKPNLQQGLLLQDKNVQSHPSKKEEKNLQFQPPKKKSGTPTNKEQMKTSNQEPVKDTYLRSSGRVLRKETAHLVESPKDLSLPPKKELAKSQKTGPIVEQEKSVIHPSVEEKSQIKTPATAPSSKEQPASNLNTRQTALQKPSYASNKANGQPQLVATSTAPPKQAFKSKTEIENTQVVNAEPDQSSRKKESVQSQQNEPLNVADKESVHIPKETEQICKVRIKPITISAEPLSDKDDASLLKGADNKGSSVIKKADKVSLLKKKPAETPPKQEHIPCKNETVVTPRKDLTSSSLPYTAKPVADDTEKAINLSSPKIPFTEKSKTGKDLQQPVKLKEKSEKKTIDQIFSLTKERGGISRVIGHSRSIIEASECRDAELVAAMDVSKVKSKVDYGQPLPTDLSKPETKKNNQESSNLQRPFSSIETVRSGSEPTAKATTESRLSSKVNELKGIQQQSLEVGNGACVAIEHMQSKTVKPNFESQQSKDAVTPQGPPKFGGMPSVLTSEIKASETIVDLSMKSSIVSEPSKLISVPSPSIANVPARISVISDLIPAKATDSQSSEVSTTSAVVSSKETIADICKPCRTGTSLTSSADRQPSGREINKGSASSLIRTGTVESKYKPEGAMEKGSICSAVSEEFKGRLIDLSKQPHETSLTVTSNTNKNLASKGKDSLGTSSVTASAGESSSSITSNINVVPKEQESSLAKFSKRQSFPADLRKKTILPMAVKKEQIGTITADESSGLIDSAKVASAASTVKQTKVATDQTKTPGTEIQGSVVQSSVSLPAMQPLKDVLPSKGALEYGGLVSHKEPVGINVSSLVHGKKEPDINTGADTSEKHKRKIDTDVSIQASDSRSEESKRSKLEESSKIESTGIKEPSKAASDVCKPPYEKEGDVVKQRNRTELNTSKELPVSESDISKNLNKAGIDIGKPVTAERKAEKKTETSEFSKIKQHNIAATHTDISGSGPYPTETVTAMKPCLTKLDIKNQTELVTSKEAFKLESGSAEISKTQSVIEEQPGLAESGTAKPENKTVSKPATPSTPSITGALTVQATSTTEPVNLASSTVIEKLSGAPDSKRGMAHPAVLENVKSDKPEIVTKVTTAAIDLTTRDDKKRQLDERPTSFKLDVSKYASTQKELPKASPECSKKIEQVDLGKCMENGVTGFSFQRKLDVPSKASVTLEAVPHGTQLSARKAEYDVNKESTKMSSVSKKETTKTESEQTTAPIKQDSGEKKEPAKIVESNKEPKSESAGIKESIKTETDVKKESTVTKSEAKEEPTKTLSELKKEPTKTESDTKKQPAQTEKEAKKEPTKTVSDTKKEPTKTVSDTKKEPIKTVSDTKIEPTKTVSDTKKEPTKTVSDTKKEPIKTVSDTKIEPTKTVSDTKKEPIKTVSDTKKEPIKTVSDTKIEPTKTVSDTKKEPTKTVSDTKKEPIKTVSDTMKKPIKTVSDTKKEPTKTVSDNKKEPMTATETEADAKKESAKTESEANKDSSKTVLEAKKEPTRTDSEAKKEPRKTEQEEKRELSKTATESKREPTNTESVIKRPTKIESEAKKEPSKPESVTKKEPAKIESYVKKEPGKTVSEAMKEPVKTESEAKKEPSVFESVARKELSKTVLQSKKEPTKTESESKKEPTTTESESQKEPIRTESEAKKVPLIRELVAKKEPAKADSDVARKEPDKANSEVAKKEPAKADSEIAKKEPAKAVSETAKKEPAIAVSEVAKKEHVKADSETEKKEPAKAVSEAAKKEPAKADLEVAKKEPAIAVSEIAKKEPAKAVSETAKKEPAIAVSEIAKKEPAKAVSETAKKEPAIAVSEVAKKEHVKADSETAKKEPAKAVSEVVKKEPAKADSEVAKKEPAIAVSEVAKKEPGKAVSETAKKEPAIAVSEVAKKEHVKADSETAKKELANADSKTAKKELVKTDSVIGNKEPDVSSVQRIVGAVGECEGGALTSKQSANASDKPESCVGEAIEEPVIVVKGDGEGALCDAGNYWSSEEEADENLRDNCTCGSDSFNYCSKYTYYCSSGYCTSADKRPCEEEACAYKATIPWWDKFDECLSSRPDFDSDVVEEDVLYFWGDGNGADCDAGNSGDEGEGANLATRTRRQTRSSAKRATTSVGGSVESEGVVKNKLNGVKSNCKSKESVTGVGTNCTDTTVLESAAKDSVKKDSSKSRTYNKSEISDSKKVPDKSSSQSNNAVVIKDKIGSSTSSKTCESNVKDINGKVEEEIKTEITDSAIAVVSDSKDTKEETEIEREHVDIEEVEKNEPQEVVRIDRRRRGRARGRPKPRPPAPKQAARIAIQEEEKDPLADDTKEGSDEVEEPVRRKPRGRRKLQKKRAVVEVAAPRQRSARIAKIREKEEQERRELEAERMLEIAEENRLRELKRKARFERRALREIKKTRKEKKKEKKRKKKKKRVKKKVNGNDPWAHSSTSSSSSSEEDELEMEEDDNEELIFKSDHEFSPESDVGEEDAQPIKRARTAKKSAPKVEVEESDSADVSDYDDSQCLKCGHQDHPETILLCDTCDNGWHLSCLRPPLFSVPEGDWICPTCEHALLIQKLKEVVAQFDAVKKKADNEELRKQRLAYINISLDNVIPDKKKRKHRHGEEEEEDDGSESGSEDSDSESDSDSDSSSGSDTDSSEPALYTLRARPSRTPKEQVENFDELINEAIREEMEAALLSKKSIGRGKDISTIVAGEKEDDLYEDEEEVQEEEEEIGKGKGKEMRMELEEEEELKMKQKAKDETEEKKVNEEEDTSKKDEKITENDKNEDEEVLPKRKKRKLSQDEDDEAEDDGSEYVVSEPGAESPPIRGRKRGRATRPAKKRRRLTDLDVDEYDDDSDEDFLGTTDEDEEDDVSEAVSSDFESYSDSDDSDIIGKRRRSSRLDKKTSRKSSRTRRNTSIDDCDSDDHRPRKQKKKKKKKIKRRLSTTDEDEEEEDFSSDSERSYGEKRKPAKAKRKPPPKSKVKKSSSKKKNKKAQSKKSAEDGEEKPKTKPKPRIKYSKPPAQEEEQEEDTGRRRTRGRQINYYDSLLMSDEDFDDEETMPKRRGKVMKGERIPSESSEYEESDDERKRRRGVRGGLGKGKVMKSEEEDEDYDYEQDKKRRKKEDPPLRGKPAAATMPPKPLDKTAGTPQPPVQGSLESHTTELPTKISAEEKVLTPANPIVVKGISSTMQAPVRMTVNRPTALPAAVPTETAPNPPHITATGMASHPQQADPLQTCAETKTYSHSATVTPVPPPSTVSGRPVRFPSARMQVAMSSTPVATGTSSSVSITPVSYVPNAGAPPPLRNASITLVPRGPSPRGPSVQGAALRVPSQITMTRGTGPRGPRASIMARGPSPAAIREISPGTTIRGIPATSLRCPVPTSSDRRSPPTSVATPRVSSAESSSIAGTDNRPKSSVVTVLPGTGGDSAQASRNTPESSPAPATTKRTVPLGRDSPGPMQPVGKWSPHFTGGNGGSSTPPSHGVAPAPGTPPRSGMQVPMNSSPPPPYRSSPVPVSIGCAGPPPGTIAHRSTPPNLPPTSHPASYQPYSNPDHFVTHPGYPPGYHPGAAHSPGPHGSLTRHPLPHPGSLPPGHPMYGPPVSHGSYQGLSPHHPVVLRGPPHELYRHSPPGHGSPSHPGHPRPILLKQGYPGLEPLPYAGSPSPIDASAGRHSSPGPPSMTKEVPQPPASSKRITQNEGEFNSGLMSYFSSQREDDVE